VNVLNASTILSLGLGLLLSALVSLFLYYSFQLRLFEYANYILYTLANMSKDAADQTMNSNSSMAHNFHYTDILETEIRLLTLLPSLSVEDPLECRLTVLTRDSAPDYEAVSYVWGADDGKYTQLRVLPSKENQIPSNKYFFIRPNLVSALKREYHFYPAADCKF
jgi:hypothetical protein